MIDLNNAKKSDELFADLPESDFKNACLRGAISAEIRNKRHQMKMTQKEFAKCLGVTQGMVSKWEAPGYNFSLNALVELFVKLNIEFDITINDKPVLKNKKSPVLSYIATDNSAAWKVSAKTDTGNINQNEVGGAA